MNILCTICMRGGSKGVKNKNLKMINGKPLMYYTIDQAIKSKAFKKIVVSTDSKKISSIARKLGAQSWFLRPKHMARDKSAKIPAIRHAFLKAESYFKEQYDILVDLDVTSPLRNIKDIKMALKKFKYENANTLITICDARKNPYFNMLELKKGFFKKVKKLRNNNDIKRRQDAPKVYEMNASIYIWKREAIIKNFPLLTKKTSIYLMPYERSIDIDTNTDFKLVDLLIKEKNDRL